MKKNLNILSSTLRSNGHIEASKSVNDLINTLDDIIMKSAFGGFRVEHEEDSDANANVQSFIGMFGQPQAEDGQPSSELQKWNKILNDYNKIPYRVEKFHEIQKSIVTKVLTPFQDKKKKLEASAPQITNEDRALTTAMLSSQSGSTGDVPDYMKEANIRNQTFLRLTKTASSNDYFDTYISEINIAAKQYEDLFLKKLARGEIGAELGLGGPSNQGFWSRLIEGDHAKAAVRAAGKKPGFWGRVLPGVGLLFSLPLALKNIHEAYINGKKIAGELPLEKYNIDRTAALTGNPLLLNKFISNIREAIKENENNPDNMYELLDILKTISAYWLDVIFAITNTLMAIIDALTVAAALVDGPLPIGDVVGGFFGFFATFGLIGVEFASEHYVYEYWDKQKSKIKRIAEEKVRKLGGVVVSDQSTNVPDYMQKETPAESKEPADVSQNVMNFTQQMLEES